MRHEKAETLLRVAMDMQSRSQGLSLQEIADRYSDKPLGRRTAERLRDAVLRLFPDQHQELTGPGGIKRWRLRTPWLRGIYQVDAATVASLETARKLLSQSGLDDAAGKLEQLRGMVTSLLNPDVQSSLETQVEALSVAEGVALRPGPRVRVDASVLATIREGLRLGRVVEIDYRYRKTNVLRHYQIHPYGLLYGHRHYLVGSRSPAGAPRYYILGRIERAEISAFSSIRPPSFSLSEYASRSFGVWQEESVSVHWRFKPEVAEDAADFVFHPSQETEWGPDGSFHVRFSAGGLQEMRWHLFTWGDGVEVLEPASLRSSLKGQ